MSNYIFLFDLDSTITSEEILPTISKKINQETEMRELTEKTMSGDIPFNPSFLQRVDLLKDIPITEVQDIVSNIKLNSHIVDFIQNNKERCYIVTGNLDVWILPLMKKIGMENRFFSSKALVKDNKLQQVTHIIEKQTVVNMFSSPFVAIGDGVNDIAMISNAKIGIAYAGVRQISTAVVNCATHIFYEENKMCEFLETLL